MPGLLDFLNPSGGLGAQGGFMDRATSFREQNPGALTALGAGIMNGNVGQGFAQAAPIIAQGHRTNATAKFLLDKGLAKSPEEAMTLAQDRELLPFVLKAPDQYTQRAEAAQRFGLDPSSAEGRAFILSGDLQGPAEAKAPQITELFDAQGQPYKAQWNPGSGTWDKLGGSKPTGTTEAVRRNKQLYSVVAPEVDNLLGNDKTPGKFDALSGTSNQLLDAGGGLVRSMTGVDPSNYATSGAYQSAKNSIKVIVANYLYSVSGATATPGEVENQVSVLLPKLGEDPTSVAEKKQRIQTMVEAIKHAAMVEDAPGGATIPPPGSDPSDPLGLRGQ